MLEMFSAWVNLRIVAATPVVSARFARSTDTVVSILMNPVCDDFIFMYLALQEFKLIFHFSTLSLPFCAEIFAYISCIPQWSR